MSVAGCHDVTRKICKSIKTGLCEAVYIATDKATKECKETITPQNIENVCGSRDSKLYNSDMECIGPVQGKNCPAQIDGIKAEHVEGIYQCLSIQKSLCYAACGARYDKIDVRNFFQTEGKPGLLCMDESIENIKNGVSLTEDKMRKSCLEVHQGVMEWCINYNLSYNGVSFGAFLQCAGRMP